MVLSISGALNLLRVGFRSHKDQQHFKTWTPTHWTSWRRGTSQRHTRLDAHFLRSIGSDDHPSHDQMRFPWGGRHELEALHKEEVLGRILHGQNFRVRSTNIRN